MYVHVDLSQTNSALQILVYTVALIVMKISSPQADYINCFLCQNNESSLTVNREHYVLYEIYCWGKKLRGVALLNGFIK